VCVPRSVPPPQASSGVAMLRRKSFIGNGLRWTIGPAAAALLLLAAIAPLDLAPALEAAPKFKLWPGKAKAPVKPTPAQAAAINRASVAQQAAQNKQAAVEPTLDPSADGETASPTTVENQPGDNRIRLTYIDTPWSMVLKDFAKETSTELVADRIPRGTWSRLDRRPYTVPEALRILNKELEPKGFRLVFKGRHLVLMDIPSTRPEYDRPVVSAAPPPREAPSPLQNANTPARIRTAPRGAGGVVTADATTSDPRANRRVRSTSDDQPASEPATGAPPVAEPAAPPAKPANAVPTDFAQTDVILENQDATDIAKAMRTAFGKQAELVQRGPAELPAFQVYRDAAATAVWFRVGIDERGNRLVIEADKADLVAVKKLIQALDVADGRVGRTLKPVATPANAAQLGRVLEQPMKELAQANRQADAQEAIDPNTPNIPKIPGDNQSLPDLLGNLKGEVAVESVPDLGVLILRGNQKDVDAVMQIIKEIERLSIGSAPDLQLVLLEHVNSEGLSELLTTIYDRLRSARNSTIQQTQTVSIIPIARPNAVLILAASADIDGVLKLVKELDQPIDSQTEFRVIKLKHAVAPQVLETLETMYPPLTQQTQQQRTQPGLVPRIRVSADVRTNAIIVQARPRDLTEIVALVESLDSSESASVSQVRIIPLKSALAEEVAETLQTAIQGVLNPARTNTTTGQGGGGLFGGGNAGGSSGGSTELRAVKSTVLQFLSPDGDAGERLRSGILADIRIASDVRTNSLVVTAPEESLPLLEALVKQLDRPAATVAEIKVFALSKADATTSAELLQQLFSGQSQNQRQGGGNRQGAVGSVPGLQVQGADDASSTLIPLRFSVDVRTNSIIAIGGAEAMRVVEAVLLRLDDSDVRQRESIVYRLKNSYAPDVQAAISRFLTSRRQIETSDSGLISPFEQIEREVVVEAEAATNSLLISATPRYFEEIRNLVEKLDAAPLQVVIQALLVEVTLDNTDEFGVELGFQDSVLFDRSIVSNVLQVPTTTTAPNGVQTTTQSIISRTVAPGFNFNNQAFGQNPINQGKVGKQSLTNFAVGRVNGDLGYGGLVLSAGSESVNVLLRALSVSRRVDVLSRPQIRTLDNQTAQIQVGQQVPIVDGVNTGIAGNAQPIVRQDQAGIILTVTPRITPDQTVVMEVVAEKSAFTGAGVPIFTDATTGNVIESPIKDLTNARAVVSVRDSQTIVLGGMITRSQEDETRKVPLLGDIPILGLAFRYDFHSHRRTELLIFLTPRVIRTDEDSELIKQIETQRIHFTECDAEEIHGPILSAPADEGYCPPGELPGELQGTPTGVMPPADAPWTERNLPATVTPILPAPNQGIEVPAAR
jgi:general secretion pathway protein D